MEAKVNGTRSNFQKRRKRIQQGKRTLASGTHHGKMFIKVTTGFAKYHQANIRQAQFTVPPPPPTTPSTLVLQRSATNLPTYNCEIIKFVKSANNSTRQIQSGSVIWRAKYRNVKRRQKAMNKLTKSWKSQRTPNPRKGNAPSSP